MNKLEKYTEWVKTCPIEGLADKLLDVGVEVIKDDIINNYKVGDVVTIKEEVLREIEKVMVNEPNAPYIAFKTVTMKEFNVGCCDFTIEEDNVGCCDFTIEEDNVGCCDFTIEEDNGYFPYHYDDIEIN